MQYVYYVTRSVSKTKANSDSYSAVIIRQDSTIGLLSMLKRAQTAPFDLVPGCYFWRLQRRRHVAV